MSRVYVGLDTAEKLGYAAWIPEENLAQVALLKGNPTEQLIEVLELTKQVFKGAPISDVVFVMERIHSFQNAVTTRSLLERYGYIKYTLLTTGYPVKEASPNVVRHFLGVIKKEEVLALMLPYYEGKKLRDDHSDALAVALFQSDLDGCEFKIDDLKIRDLVKETADE